MKQYAHGNKIEDDHRYGFRNSPQACYISITKRNKEKDIANPLVHSIKILSVGYYICESIQAICFFCGRDML